MNLKQNILHILKEETSLKSTMLKIIDNVDTLILFHVILGFLI